MPIGWGDFNESYGHTFGVSAFAASNVRKWWHLFFYSEDDVPISAFHSRRAPWETTDEKSERERRILRRVESLFSDSFWLARSIGLTKVPGLDGIDTTGLYGGAKTWIWLVFHAAWARPAGTILRADQFIPVGTLGRIIYRQKEEAAVGFPPGSKKSPSDYTTARRAITERNKNIREDDRLKLQDEAMYEAEQQSGQLLEKGSFVSTLPMDPFTASAALLDLMSAETIPAVGTTPPPPPPAVVLSGLGKPVLVFGEEQSSITDPQYNVIDALIAAGERGLNKDELANKSGHGDAVRILKRISKLSDQWRKVIGLAGKAGGRYRILRRD